uniref:IS110 family transposase n=1 Tax=uncultured bacterium contig00076 TaxID=1181554 RepID=A0A806K1I5_9BACT|nr:IS110 family transposase [uncultured bacterium contig00076]
MQFIGIDLHTNKFTCCYRDGNSTPEGKGKITETFELTDYGMAQFYQTLTLESYVLIEATITTFCFARLIQPLVKEVIIANTYELKQISLARKNTDKIDADILCRILKMQVLSGEKTISPVTIPPVEIQDLRSLFSTYRLLKKQTVQIKNRIHSLLKEKLYGFTQEEIFDKKSRKMLRENKGDHVLSFQIELLFDGLERQEAAVQELQDRIKEYAAPFMKEIDILTSMKGVSVFIAIAIIADIIKVDRFKNSKSFTSYLRSAPRVSNSNTTKSSQGTNKKGRKLSATLLTQAMPHVLSVSKKLDNWYTELTQHKKAGLVRSALRRRIFAEIYQMLKKGNTIMGGKLGNMKLK